MSHPFRGLALIAFAILFYDISGALQEALWRWHIGISIPWALIALGIGVAGLILTFKGSKP